MASNKERRRAKLQEATWKSGKEKARFEASQKTEATSRKRIPQKEREVRGLPVSGELPIRQTLRTFAARRSDAKRRKQRRVNKNVLKYLPKREQ